MSFILSAHTYIPEEKYTGTGNNPVITCKILNVSIHSKLGTSYKINKLVLQLSVYSA